MPNDCYKCPLRRAVPGSAHSECGLLDKENFYIRAAVANNPASLTIKDDTTGKSLITFNQHGIKKGWCAWPLNFDPIWVKCEIPVAIMEKMD
jgi:hypothetical protein